MISKYVFLQLVIVYSLREWFRKSEIKKANQKAFSIKQKLSIILCRAFILFYLCHAKQNKYMDSILIIDDEPQIRKLLSRMMELEGYEVFQAADCQSTLKQLKLHNPQVVLCDVFLPDGNGVDMVTTIKNSIQNWR